MWGVVRPSAIASGISPPPGTPCREERAVFWVAWSAIPCSAVVVASPVRPGDVLPGVPSSFAELVLEVDASAGSTAAAGSVCRVADEGSAQLLDVGLGSNQHLDARRIVDLRRCRTRCRSSARLRSLEARACPHGRRIRRRRRGCSRWFRRSSRLADRSRACPRRSPFSAVAPRFFLEFGVESALVASCIDAVRLADRRPPGRVIVVRPDVGPPRVIGIRAGDSGSDLPSPRSRCVDLVSRDPAVRRPAGARSRARDP